MAAENNNYLETAQNASGILYVWENGELSVWTKEWAMVNVDLQQITIGEDVNEINGKIKNLVGKQVDVEIREHKYAEGKKMVTSIEGKADSLEA